MSFTVDSRPEIATWSQGVIYADINGNFVWDPEGQDNDAVNRDFVYKFGEVTDATSEEHRRLIQAGVRYFLSDEDADSVNEFLTIIHEESVRLSRLVTNLLDLDRVESGRMEWDFRKHEIQDAVRRAPASDSVQHLLCSASGRRGGGLATLVLLVGLTGLVGLVGFRRKFMK